MRFDGGDAGKWLEGVDSLQLTSPQRRGSRSSVQSGRKYR